MMKRRSFLALASASPCTLVGLQAAAVDGDALPAAWAETIKSCESGIFQSEEGTLRLEVELIGMDDDVTEELVAGEEGEETVYRFNGDKLPRWLRPQDGMIKRFRFFWDGREVPVEKRFWNDFAGCSIEKSPIQAESIPEEHRYQFGEFLGGLEGPKVVLSADGGTALIEWSIIDTDACCGHRATVRWIIGKSGAVMRHRHTTPGMC